MNINYNNVSAKLRFIGERWAPYSSSPFSIFKNHSTTFTMKQRLFYTELAKHYDKIYHYVDYKIQIIFFRKLIEKFIKTPNRKILDAACGTGTHADNLQKLGYAVTGLDISDEMLNEARKKSTKVKFLHGDIKKFQLDEKFGTIICFFNDSFW